MSRTAPDRQPSLEEAAAHLRPVTTAFPLEGLEVLRNSNTSTAPQGASHLSWLALGKKAL